jgi:hypothetical protein
LVQLLENNYFCIRLEYKRCSPPPPPVHASMASWPPIYKVQTETMARFPGIWGCLARQGWDGFEHAHSLKLWNNPRSLVA